MPDGAHTVKLCGGQKGLVESNVLHFFELGLAQRTPFKIERLRIDSADFQFRVCDDHWRDPVRLETARKTPHCVRSRGTAKRPAYGLQQLAFSLAQFDQSCLGSEVHFSPVQGKGCGSNSRFTSRNCRAAPRRTQAAVLVLPGASDEPKRSRIPLAFDSQEPVRVRCDDINEPFVVVEGPWQLGVGYPPIARPLRDNVNCHLLKGKSTSIYLLPVRGIWPGVANVCGLSHLLLPLQS